MQIVDDFKPYIKDIIELENTYLTKTLKSLDANDKVIVAIDDNKLLGYLYYSLVIDEAEIISICVNPLYRRRGIASKMLSYLISKGVNLCYLDVKENNIPAISLYQSFGFLEYLRRSNYYSDNSNAILMKWSR